MYIQLKFFLIYSTILKENWNALHLLLQKTLQFL
ncbi:hypothetical protein Mgra_00005885 [Meloidogyne graminicola]|uniref:Uncharacterized protein n=1 Tax=Meloidogyne graminicola TaxID=189291 RepID=A0A8S9ZMN4_9BILA|nr:hypothetical protein Mgra_00005885 [Meloidogyne graminicola]